MSTGDGAPSRPRDLLIVIGALGAAAALATIAGIYAGKAKPSVAAMIAAPRTSTVAAPVTIAPEPVVEVVADPLVRPIPPDVLRTATVTAAPWAPGLRLVASRLTTDWESRRAEIEDRVSGDVRSYAIGDLLPHGSLLVGISTATADIMVADSVLVRLHQDGRIEPLEDLAKAFEPAALKAAPDLDRDYEDDVRIALIDLRSDDPTIVQTAIDKLIAAGDPALELLVPYADSILPVRSAEYAFPTGSGVEMRPRVAGEIVMMILERITGQTFGDLQKEELSAEDRKNIARQWRRWWNGH